VAERVVNMSGYQSVTSNLGRTGIQRKCVSCQEEEEKLRLKENGEPSTEQEVPPIVSEVIKSTGTPLDYNTRSYMERRIGYDFSEVKVHTGIQAAKSAQSINALAYTTGKDIVFNEGQFTPSTENGKLLLAHELTHVVQQNPSIRKKSIKDSLPVEHIAGEIIQRYLTFAPDPRPKGSAIHNAVLPMFADSNSDLFIEVRIPGANKKDVDKGVTGIADFYKASSTGGKSRTIGIKFDESPGFLTSSGKLEGGGKGYLHNQDSAPKGGKYRPRVRSLDVAPEIIQIGDLKPGGSAEVTLGIGQVGDYKLGISNTASDINTYLGVNPDQHDGAMKKSWNPNPASMTSLTIPPNLEYPTGQGISPGNLALYQGDKKFPVMRDTGLTGKLFVYKDVTGIWSYEWIPDSIPASTGSGMVNTVLDRLNNQVIPAIQSTKSKTTVAPKRISPLPVKQKKKTILPHIQKKDKKFDSSEWRKKQFDPWATEAKRFLGDEKEVGKAQVAEGVVDVNKRIGNKLSIPSEVKERGKGLGRIKHWKNFGKAYGFLREKFDFIYVKIKGVINKVKAKVKRLSRTSAGTAFGNWVKAVAKVIFKIFKVVGSWVIHQTVDKLISSLQEGISNNINKLIDKLMPEEAEKKLAEFEALKQKYQEIIDQKEDQIIAFFFGDKLKLFENLEKWESIAGTVSTIVDLIKWGVRIIACASPPALGCLWNLAISAIEFLFAKLIQTCWFSKKAVGPVIRNVSMVREFPSTLASEMVTAANKFIPLPAGMDPLFAAIPKIDANNFKYECGEGDDGGSGQISGDRQAILDLAEEIGDEKMLAFVEMANKRGAGPWVLLTKERIDLMKEGLNKVTVEDLKKMANSTETETPIEFEEFFKDIKKYTPKEKKLIKEWREKKSGEDGDKGEGKGKAGEGSGKEGEGQQSDKPIYGPPPGKITGSVISYFSVAYPKPEIKTKNDRSDAFLIGLRVDIVDGGESYTVILMGINVKLYNVDDQHIYFENQKEFSVYYTDQNFVHYEVGKIIPVRKESTIQY